jgi:hypothetical protein
VTAVSSKRKSIIIDPVSGKVVDFSKRFLTSHEKRLKLLIALDAPQCVIDYQKKIINRLIKQITRNGI